MSEVCARAVGSSLSLSFCLSVQPTYSLSTFLSWFVSTVADTFLKSTNPTRRSLNQGPVSDSFVSAVLFFFFLLLEGSLVRLRQPSSPSDFNARHGIKTHRQLRRRRTSAQLRGIVSFFFYRQQPPWVKKKGGYCDDFLSVFLFLISSCLLLCFLC